MARRHRLDEVQETEFTTREEYQAWTKVIVGLAKDLARELYLASAVLRVRLEHTPVTVERTGMFSAGSDSKAYARKIARELLKADANLVAAAAHIMRAWAMFLAYYCQPEKSRSRTRGMDTQTGQGQRRAS